MKGVLTLLGPGRPFESTIRKERSGPVRFGSLRFDLRIARSRVDVQWNAPLFGDRLMTVFALRFCTSRRIEARIECFFCPNVDREVRALWASGQRRSACAGFARLDDDLHRSGVAVPSERG